MPAMTCCSGGVFARGCVRRKLVCNAQKEQFKKDCFDFVLACIRTVYWYC